jgi:hypothetical protein
MTITATAAPPEHGWADARWLTDFCGDLPKIDVPTLAVHLTAGRILEATTAASGTST